MQHCETESFDMPTDRQKSILDVFLESPDEPKLLMTDNVG